MSLRSAALCALLLFVGSCSSPDGRAGSDGKPDTGTASDQDAGGDAGSDETDAGGGGATKSARVLSVSPTYTVADETYKYRPKASSAEAPAWKVEQGPKGLGVSDDGASVSWTPSSDQKGKHEYTLKTQVAGQELRQSGSITVAVADERAAVDVDEKSGGTAIVTAPKSKVAGAGVSTKPGSLKGATRVTVSEVDSAPDMGLTKGATRAVQFGPSGTVFAEPALITLPLPEGEISNPQRVGAYVYDPQGHWERVPVVAVDTDKGVVHAKAKHFSIYAAGESALSLMLSATLAPENGVCAGSAFVGAFVEEPLTQLGVAQIAHLPEALAARVEDGKLASLLGVDGLSGSLRLVRVVELGQGQAGDRVILDRQLLVTTLFLPGDGSARVTHTDALGNALGSFDFDALRDNLAPIWSHLSGRALRAVFDQAPTGPITVSARLHALFFDDDAALDPVSADDLGFALADSGELLVQKPAVDARDADLDCDGLLKAYDASDDRLMPRIVARPLGVIAGVAGQPVRLSAQLLNAPAGSALMWRVLAGTAALDAVPGEPGARDFRADKAGRYLVEVGAQVDDESLGNVFAIDVSPELALPRCVPSPERAVLKPGESVALSSVLDDTGIPASTLQVEWGSLVDGTFVALAGLEPRGREARFRPTATGRYALACRALQGARSGAAGETGVDVVAADSNLPPTDLILSPSYHKLLVGESVGLLAQAKDPEGGALQFGWSASGGQLGAAQGSSGGSKVSFSASQPALYTIRVDVEDPRGAAVTAQAFVLVLSKSSDADGADADRDGWPSGLDCDDQNPKVHPGVLDRCGDDIDDDCSGSAAVSDCDGDGYTQEQGDCDDQAREVNPRAAERCDGIDNDCDGLSDEGFSIGASCSVGRGECAASASFVCAADGFSALCPATPNKPQPELCDGVDNDCDGALDEDYVARPVRCGVGACMASGSSACVAGNVVEICTPGAPAASDQSCNGVDDDCNEQIDEDVVKLAEVCNGLDDNCDQRVDEGLTCAGTPAPGCAPSGAEQCNGLDDDCDGRYDEDGVCGVTPEPGSLLGVYWDCGDAACTRFGNGGMMFLPGGKGLKLETFDHGVYDPATGPYCVERPFQYALQTDQVTLVWQDQGGAQQTAQGTFQISGAHLSVSFSSGPADMLGSFQLVRTPEQAGGACPNGPVCQANEVCGNGFDDNCNGKDDKSDPECASCTGDKAPEVCDKLDNDCNGVIDDLTQPCTAAGALGVCRHGHLTCPQQGSQPLCAPGAPDVEGELCADGLDNDCDDQVDEAGCKPLSPGETCYNAIDVTAGGVFAMPRGARNDVLGSCRPDQYLDRVLFLRTPGGLSGQYVIRLESSVKTDLGGTLYKAPAGYVPGSACPPLEGGETYCVGGPAGPVGRESMVYLSPASTYLLVVEASPDPMAQGAEIRVSVARSNEGICAPGDGDGDDVTICGGDCDDSAQARRPGAPELCNQLDDDCDGLIDEQDGTCATGLPGVCALGLSQCGASPSCLPIQRAARDYCGDGVDNDCNGSVDDNCVSAAGEACDNAQSLGVGGPVSGSLSSATDDAISRCGLSGPERFYRFDVPAAGAYVQLAEARYRGAIHYTLYKNCSLEVEQCDFKSAWLAQGSYVLAVEGAGSDLDYAFTLALSDGERCLTPDVDLDGQDACAGDCDESIPSVREGGDEGTSCDGIDNDCNGMVDDVRASCSLSGLLGACASGALRCDPKTPGGSCTQVVFPDALGRDICGDGVDNDCDGAADAQDPQLCVSVPSGDVCGLAYQADLSAMGVFSGTLAGYGDDVDLGCGDGGLASVERFYTLTLSERRVLRLELRAAGGAAGDGYVGIARVDDCRASHASGVECTGSFFTRELGPGTYTFAVFGRLGQAYTLLASSVLPGDDAGTSCSPGDLDGDGYTLCTSDCGEGNAAVHYGAPELCDSLDNDCNGMVDENIPGQPCVVAGAQGVCAQGMLVCAQGALVCSGPQPGQQPELCNDGRDNDCDGMADDRGTPGVDCQQLTGDRCEDALPIGDGFFDGTLTGAGHQGNGCYGGVQGEAEERYHVFQAPAPGFYYLLVRPTAPGAFPPYAAGIFYGPCGMDMPNNGCSGSSGTVVYYYLDKPGPHYVMVESDDPFDYRIGLARTDAQGVCSLPDGDGDGMDLCNFDCDDQNGAIHPGASEVCNGRDDDCNGVIDEGC